MSRRPRSAPVSRRRSRRSRTRTSPAIAGIVLFTFGTGPVRGFAVVLSLGILTSMFTALVGSRALIHLIWGRQRKLESLSI